MHATNNYADTALHVAARAGFLPIVTYLIAKGADVQAKNRFGVRALEYARRHQRREWEAIVAVLAEEECAIDELPPGARALRKIRAAMLAQSTTKQPSPA